MVTTVILLLQVTACCCLFLAGKVEETPKKCKDIMKTAKSLMDEVTWAEFGTDPREEVRRGKEQGGRGETEKKSVLFLFWF